MQLEYPMPLSARRARPVKKTANKRIITFVIAMVLLLGSAQTYAAVALGTNIIDLIKSGIQTLTASQVADVSTQSETIQTQYTTSLQEAVTTTKNNAANALSQHTQAELARARQELTAYLDKKQQDMNSAINPEIESSKTEITNKVNDAIASIKAHLDQEFQNALSNVWKKQ